MLQVYETPEGITVRENVRAIEISPGDLYALDEIVVSRYIEDVDATLVHAYHGPLVVGRDYPHIAIKPVHRMTVMSKDTYEVYQYREWTVNHVRREGWWILGSAGTKKNLDSGTYTVTFLGVHI